VRARRAAAQRPERPPTPGEARLAITRGAAETLEPALSTEAVRQVVRGTAEGIEAIAKANRAARQATAKRPARKR
jgi:hypothetical protein